MKSTSAILLLSLGLSGCAAGTSGGGSFSAASTVTYITVTPGTATISEGSSQVLTATVLDQNHNAMAGVDLSWQDMSEMIGNCVQGTGCHSGYTATVNGVACGTSNVAAVAPNGISGSVVLTVTSTTDFNCLPSPPTQTLTSGGTNFVNITCGGVAATKASPIDVATGSTMQCVGTVPAGWNGGNQQCANGTVSQVQGTFCIWPTNWVSDNPSASSVSQNSSIWTATLTGANAGVTYVYLTGDWAEYASPGTSTPTQKGTFTSNAVYVLAK